MNQFNLGTRVAARLNRQRILEREHPPVCWVVLSEAVLHQEVGSRGMMREQLARLLAVQKRTCDGGTLWDRPQT
ncbi:Scr1 family TA system antitoxin-like transcriptional regulator [Streptomyces antibioticus]|uniref:Scr1 family TA system antitoxin-like transcriptional regulator n=1 Tax=Streptomyces antibioticus TaxID=1890 RepID=UPI0036DB2C7E